MERFTLFVGDREFELARLDTLRELLQRKLISPSDKILFEGETEPVDVAQALEGRDLGSLVDGPIAPEGAADDLWEAWSNTDSFPVDDLVSGLLGEAGADEPSPTPDPPDSSDPEPVWGVSGEIFEPEAEPETPAAAGAPAGEPEELPASVIEDLPVEAIDEVDSLRTWEPLTDDPSRVAPPPHTSTPPPRASTAPPTLVGDTSDAGPRPSTFVEFVQQRRAAGMDLEIRGDESPVLPSTERRRRIGPWPIVLGLLAVVGFGSMYGTGRTGATRNYPTESELRAKLAGGGAEPSTAEPATEAPTEPTEAPTADGTDGATRPETALRPVIPVALQRFKNVEEFEDVLFTDIANAGVMLRELHIEALVVAPLPDEHRQRPEEVNIALRLDALEGHAGEDALAKAVLVLGHYGADAHVRIRRVVLHVRHGPDLNVVYELQGDVAVSFFERQVDLAAFLLALQQVEGNQYLLEPDEDVAP